MGGYDFATGQTGFKQHQKPLRKDLGARDVARIILPFRFCENESSLNPKPYDVAACDALCSPWVKEGRWAAGEAPQEDLPKP